jgi:TolB-like protein/class 3 adenylate cyclase/Tfp pilus assembly protein PilF
MGDIAGVAVRMDEPSRRLVAIMFTDLVGYSAMAHRDEALAIELLELHRAWVREILPPYGGREIETVGDAFLIEFAGALAAVECAIAIQRRFAEYNTGAPAGRHMELRIGIHLGDVEHKGDKVFGDGVNIASRIHGMAKPGGICVSEDVHHAVRNRPAFQFTSLGTPPLKHISTPLELFELASSLSLARPAAAAVPAPQQPAAFRRRYAVPLAATVALVALAAGFWTVWQRPVAPAGTPSVAVLPFSNFSSEKENEYFAAGIHESILTLLASVKDLKVISRTSVMQYGEGTRNLPDIGRALGVANIVEGSVQRTGNRVRVHAQLIEAATDRHLWAESYDRDLADVFAIQSEVAQRIVASVQATLTPEEKGRLEQRPTANPAAYDHYLKARVLVREVASGREQMFAAQTLLEQAIQLDPGFAVAHAELGWLHMAIYWNAIDTTVRRREQARTEAETALRLQPGLPEGHLALGTYFYQGFRDYDRALAELGEALSRAPNSTDIQGFIGYVQRRRGQWDTAVVSLNRAIELDPRNAFTVIEVGDTHLRMRHYAKAAALYEKAAGLVPADVPASLMPAFLPVLWRGDTATLGKALAAIPPGVDPGQVVSKWRIVLALWEGRYAEAIALLNRYPHDGLALATGTTFGASNFETPKDIFIGEAYVASGDAARARPHFVRARDFLQAYIAREPESAYLAEAHAQLGLTHAYLGERAEALRRAEEAIKLLPISRDALDGPEVAAIAAAVHMRLGDADRALTELARLLGTPAGPHAHDLQRYPEWKPLWNDPRFRKLIAENTPKGG